MNNDVRTTYNIDDLVKGLGLDSVQPASKRFAANAPRTVLPQRTLVLAVGKGSVAGGCDLPGRIRPRLCGTGSTDKGYAASPSIPRHSRPFGKYARQNPAEHDRGAVQDQPIELFPVEDQPYDGDKRLCRMPQSRSKPFPVSTNEWTPSESIAELPVNAAAKNLVTAMARLPAIAA